MTCKDGRHHLDMFIYTAFIVTFTLIALTEIGDKTQLVVIALASKTRRMGMVAAGSTLGIALVVILGVTVGTVLDFLIPVNLIDIGGAIVFIALGLILLVQTVRHRGKESKDYKDGKLVKRSGSAFFGSALSVGLMEFGDKTQVATITLAATYDSPFSVAFGAILAEGLLMLVGAFVGAKLLARIRRDVLEYFSSILFVIAGLMMLFVY